MTRRMLLVFGLVSVLLLGVINLVYAQDSGPQVVDAPQAVMGTAFTYQGQLKSGGTAVSGSCEMAFRLYDAASAGYLIGSPITQTVTVNAGLFTTQLNFGASAFNGQGRWLETAVKCGSDTIFTTLSRQALTPAPYALALPGLRTEPNNTSPNIIGGYNGNTISSTARGSVIGGGGADLSRNQILGDYAVIGGGKENTIDNNDYGVIGGGFHNYVDGIYSAIGGGLGNSLTGTYATIGGGQSNYVWGNAATIGGGQSNIASGVGATIGGGGANGSTIDGNRASANASTVGGGYSNNITKTADYAVIAGGYDNYLEGYSAAIAGGYANYAAGKYAAVGGGFNNGADGNYATIPGGLYNSASMSYTFAAGSRAFAQHTGTFVWSDASSTNPFWSTADNQFLVRAAGGVGINTNDTLADGLTVDGRVIAGGPATDVAGGEPLVARGANAGVSLEERSDATKRWVMFANNGTWRLWNGTDRVQVGSTGALSITTNAGNAGAVAVGERYRDNAIIAWGDVAAAGNLSADFGVASVAHSTGIYTITLTASAVDGFSLVPTAIAEVDSPPTSAASARLITINTIAANQFVVYITTGSYALVDNQFYFSVTGR